MVEKIKGNYHPNAYLQRTRNVTNGLKARTRVLEQIEVREVTARTIAKTASLSYNATIHHLKLLEREGIVKKNGEKPYLWATTGTGQKRL